MSKADKDADYRRALYNLISQGYKLKRLAKVIKEMSDEAEYEKEELMAEYEMGRGPCPR
jgi:hypothetical protein